MNQLRKRIGSFVIAICMVVTLLPAIALTAIAKDDVTGRLNIGGERASDLTQNASGTNWSWNASEHRAV